MNNASAISLDGVRATTGNKLNPARLFYAAAATIMLAVTVMGFQQFYLHGRAVGGRPISPQILPLVIAHGVLMSSWIILFAVQPLLILRGKRRVHVMLGIAGAGLAIAIVIIGILLAIVSTRAHPDLVRWGLTQKQFMAHPMATVLKFSVFVGLGIGSRRRPDMHRSMMLLATLTMVQPAAARISFLTAPYKGTVAAHLVGPALPILVLGAVLLGTRWLLTRRLDRPFALGYTAVLLTSPLVMILARSQAWDHFATFVTQ